VLVRFQSPVLEVSRVADTWKILVPGMSKCRPWPLTSLLSVVVAHWPFKPEWVGSNPTGGTTRQEPS
jgi:hypothetical protein